MFDSLASRLGYSSLGLMIASLWLVYTGYFMVLGLAGIILSPFKEVKWLQRLQDYPRWGRWNPLDTLIFIWHGWWASSLITLITMILIEAVTWMSLSGFLHLFPQIGSLIVAILSAIIGLIIYLDR
ncbi:hypothetical protein KBD34_04440 [Patescibacteria group bacterium]|nr:hypothetical protein [Patescibacteria group bacterium]